MIGLMSRMTEKEWKNSIEWVGIVAGCVLKKDGKYLLVQEKQPSAYGLWNLPAGHVDKGESVVHAAVRETKEETGYDVTIIKELPVTHEGSATPVKHAFFAQIIGGELAFQQNELLAARWLTYEDVENLKKSGKLRAEWVWNSITEVENQ